MVHSRLPDGDFLAVSMVTDREGTRSGGRSRSQAPEWLTLGQAARYLGVAQSTVRKWSDGGRLPAFYTPGGHRRFRRSDLDSFLGSSRGASRPRPLVLIVDDDDGLREFLRANLELEGYFVREAESAERGLAALEEERPDLILLDVMMPRVDGWEMLRRVRERHGMETIPVVMFSGKVDAAVSAVEKQGAQAFVGKPFDPAKLLESTKQLLRT
ncbi:MAG: response regulator [Actinomycetota bacterium]|nr:response regulator [Actinomycetota bacterium]